MFFEHSDSPEITVNHVPRSKVEEFDRMNKSVHKLNTTKLVKLTVKLAKQLWKDRIDLNSPVMCTHDTYLKLFQLSKPTLVYDCIVGDEFQDVNPVVADIVLNQKIQKVLIGDPNQSIYGWRGAQNFLIDNPDYHRLYLSKSFRYGQAIADLAMMVINYKRKLKGFEQKTSVIGKVDTTKPYTKIFRTNACLLSEAVDLINDGISVMFDINHRDFVNKLQNVISLKDGDNGRVKHADIIIFESFEELLAEAEFDHELKRMVSIIDKDQADDVIRTLSSYRKPRKANVIFTTGHKAKGLEWDYVILANDFRVPIDDDGEYYELPQGEINLLYVCLTRAVKVLETNGAISAIIEERSKVYPDNDELIESETGLQLENI